MSRASREARSRWRHLDHASGRRRTSAPPRLRLPAQPDLLPSRDGPPGPPVASPAWRGKGASGWRSLFLLRHRLARERNGDEGMTRVGIGGRALGHVRDSRPVLALALLVGRVASSARRRLGCPFRQDPARGRESLASGSTNHQARRPSWRRRSGLLLRRGGQRERQRRDQTPCRRNQKRAPPAIGG
jgi:hypothetical protein